MARLILELHKTTQFDQENESEFWKELMVDANSVETMRQDPLLPKWGQRRGGDVVPSHFTDVARFLVRAFLEQRCPFRTCTHHL
jgi:hypothetical protein